MEEGLDYTYEAPEDVYQEPITYEQFQSYLQILQEDGEPPEVLDYWIALWLEQKEKE